jgi:hypothetical protein
MQLCFCRGFQLSIRVVVMYQYDRTQRSNRQIVCSGSLAAIVA